MATSKKPRLVVQVSNVLNACDFYRGYMPLKQLDENDAISARIVSRFGLLDAYGGDIVIVFRPRDPNILNIMEPARWQGCEVVADWDDDIFSVPVSNYCCPNFGQNEVRTSGLVASNALCVSASTTTMASRLKKYNENIAVLPNSIDWKQIENISRGWKSEKKDYFKILWAGSVTHVEDQMVILAPLRKLLKKYNDIQVTFLGFAFNFFMAEFPGRIAVQSMVDMFHYLRVLRDMNPDLVVQPLMNHPFNYSKSNIRFLEAGSFGFPTLASNTPAFEMLTENFCMTAPWDEQVWFEKLEWCYQNPTALKLMGKRARYVIEKYWSIQKTWKNWDMYFKSILNREPLAKDFTVDMDDVWKKEFLERNAPKELLDPVEREVPKIEIVKEAEVGGEVDGAEVVKKIEKAPAVAEGEKTGGGIDAADL